MKRNEKTQFQKSFRKECFQVRRKWPPSTPKHKVFPEKVRKKRKINLNIKSHTIKKVKIISNTPFYTYLSLVQACPSSFATHRTSASDAATGAGAALCSS